MHWSYVSFVLSHGYAPNILPCFSFVCLYQPFPQVCSSKKERLEPAYHSQPTPIPEVVVESGPVDYQGMETQGP